MKLVDIFFSTPFLHNNNFELLLGPLTIDTENYVGGIPTLLANENSWTKVKILHELSPSSSFFPQFT